MISEQSQRGLKQLINLLLHVRALLKTQKKFKGGNLSSDCVEGSNFFYGDVILISWLLPEYESSNAVEGQIHYKNWEYSTPEEKGNALKACNEYKKFINP